MIRAISEQDLLEVEYFVFFPGSSWSLFLDV